MVGEPADEEDYNNHLDGVGDLALSMLVVGVHPVLPQKVQQHYVGCRYDKKRYDKRDGNPLDVVDGQPLFFWKLQQAELIPQDLFGAGKYNGGYGGHKG